MRTKCKELHCYNDAVTTGGYCVLHVKHALPKRGYHGHNKPRTPALHLGAELECVGANDTVERAMRACGVAPHSDASLRSGIGCEFKFCKPADLMLRVLPEFAEKLTDVGAKVNGSCGFHVHLDARGVDYSRRAAFKSWLESWESWWFSLIPQGRRNSTFVKPISNGGHYAWFNWTSYNTGEVRLHPGTLNPHKIRGWLAVCRDLLNLLHAKNEDGTYKALPSPQSIQAGLAGSTPATSTTTAAATSSPAVGSVLTKVYRGVTYQVVVRGPGDYFYNGRSWTNLTAIARSIIGYRVSGPAWFNVEGAAPVVTVPVTGVFGAEATEYIQARLASNGSMRPTTVAAATGQVSESESEGS